MLKILRPVFEDLSKEELLKRFMHCKKQNANESFYNIVWLKYPKTVFVNRQNTELGPNSAILQFNGCPHGTSNVLEQFLIKYGIYTNISSNEKDVFGGLVLNLAKQGRKNVNDYVASKRCH